MTSIISSFSNRRRIVLIVVGIATCILTAGATVVAVYRYLPKPEVTLQYGNGGEKANLERFQNLEQQQGGLQALAEKYPRITPVDVAKSSFNRPYPVAWTEGNGLFSITEAWIGSVLTSSNIIDMTDGSVGDTYAPGTKVYAVVFKIKVDVGPQVSRCVNPTLRRVTEDQDFLPPNIRQLYLPGTQFNCPGLPSSTYQDLDMIFVVPEGEKQFMFTYGTGQLSIFKLAANPNGSVTLTK